ncbi:hypothetical protein CONPUDRAFT_30536, partial [Coniophora puteana RWD-64-598 SS2]
KEKHIGDPTHFDGNRKDAIRWFISVRVYLEENHEIYDTDESWVKFATQRMTKGTAREWVDSFYQKVMAKEYQNRRLGSTESAWGTWNEFGDQFWLSFQPLDQENSAISEMQTLTQKKCRTLDDYIQKFQSAFMRSKLPDGKTIVQMFMRGLDQDLTLSIINRGKPPETLADWIPEVTEAYNWRRQYSVALGHKLPEASLYKNQTSHSHNHGGNRSHQRDPNAMDVDAIDFQKRKEYRKQGKCYLCHKTGH